VWKQLGVVERAGLRKVAGRSVHIDRVPERDGSNGEVECHGAFLLCRVRAIMNAPLRVGKDGFRQRVARFTLVQARIALRISSAA